MERRRVRDGEGRDRTRCVQDSRDFINSSHEQDGVVTTVATTTASEHVRAMARGRGSEGGRAREQESERAGERESKRARARGSEGARGRKGERTREQEGEGARERRSEGA